jgi:ABC-type multidrug transport system fused ATPase/permease subunit
MTSRTSSKRGDAAEGRVPQLPLLRFALHGHGPIVTAVVIVGLLGGLFETATVALIALSAAALVEGSRHVHIALSGVHVTIAFSRLIDIAFAAAGLRLVTQLPLIILPARMSADAQARLRRQLFDAFSNASWAEQARDSEGHLQELMSNQTAQAASTVSGVAGLVAMALTFVILILGALALDPLAAVAVLGAVVLISALMRPLNRVVVRRSSALSQLYMDFANGLGEAARLAQEVRAFGVVDAQRRSMGALVGSAQRLAYRLQVLGRLGPSLYQSFIYLMVVTALASLRATNASHVASFGAAVLLLIRAGGYGQLLQSAYQGLLTTLPFVGRVRATTERYLASAPVTGDRPLDGVVSLSAERIDYSYVPGRPVLSDVSFTVAAGEAIGVVGPSGAGKSTLSQLVVALRAPDGGRYLVNDIPAEEYARADWHALFAYVPQEPRLLHASVADNIRFFRELDDDAVERAARLARIHEDIVTWPHGYDTIVGPRADGVSGGQQQRLCIARALAGRPSVLVLDEPTSALDPRSESLIQESLSSIKDELTLFIVAHRMSTLDICDRIMVVIDGRLAAFDTPAKLRLDSSYFREALSVAARGVTDIRSGEGRR